MKHLNNSGWQFKKQITLSVLIQMTMIASLIIGSWVNIQSQLDILQHDVQRLLTCQQEYSRQIKSLTTRNISYRYRLKRLEKQVAKLRENK